MATERSTTAMASSEVGGFFLDLSPPPPPLDLSPPPSPTLHPLDLSLLLLLWI